MDDELESLLREHYGRAAQTIHPDPDLAVRLRAARLRPARRRLRLGRLALAAAAVVVVGLTWAGFSGNGDHAEPAAVQAPRVAITISGTPIAGREELTGSASPGGPVALVVESQRNEAWIPGPTVTAVGAYRTRVNITPDTTALRVCTQATPITCSPPLLLPPATPSPIGSPAVSPSSTPQPNTTPPAPPLPSPPSARRPRSHTPSPNITPH